MPSPTEGQERAATPPMRMTLDLQGLPAERLTAAAGSLSSLLSIVCCREALAAESPVSPVSPVSPQSPGRPG